MIVLTVPLFYCIGTIPINSLFRQSMVFNGFQFWIGSATSVSRISRDNGQNNMGRILYIMKNSLTGLLKFRYVTDIVLVGIWIAQIVRKVTTGYFNTYSVSFHKNITGWPPKIDLIFMGFIGLQLAEEFRINSAVVFGITMASTHDPCRLEKCPTIGIHIRQSDHPISIVSTTGGKQRCRHRARDFHILG